MKMPEISVDVSSLKHIEDEYCNYNVISFYNKYRSWIIIFIIMSIVCGIIVVILLNNNSKPSTPCLSYSSQTLANQVSIACLQYTWNYLCPTNPYTFSSTYSGYWNSSPQGTAIVSCSQNSVCGIGSYGNILVYMQYCNHV